jgi:glycosyltransferase 2 family protein
MEGTAPAARLRLKSMRRPSIPDLGIDAAPAVPRGRKGRLRVAAQLTVGTILVGFLAFAFRDALGDAGPRLRHADLSDLALSALALIAYYAVFVLGWKRILRDWGIVIPYRVALGAEMASMLAKYIPGGVWTPAARVVALRRVGIEDTGLVVASILLEAGVSALAGVLVFVAGLAAVDSGDAPLLPLGAFALAIAVLLHPRVFTPLARRLLRPLGGGEMPPLRGRTLAELMGFYAFTWLIGGVALLFLVRAVGGDPDLDSVPYLGGTAAVGAIVAVVTVIAPSGLGVREASMYGLMLAVTASGPALGATIMNRVAITFVEIVLLAIGGGLVLLRRRAAAPPAAGPIGGPSAEA